jgi:uncharacterized membrane protein YkgB
MPSKRESRSDTIAGVAFMVGLVAVIVGIGLLAHASIGVLVLIGGVGIIAGRPVKR